MRPSHALAGGALAGALAGIVGLVLTRAVDRPGRDEAPAAGSAVRRKDVAVPAPKGGATSGFAARAKGKKGDGAVGRAAGAATADEKVAPGEAGGGGTSGGGAGAKTGPGSAVAASSAAQPGAQPAGDPNAASAALERSATDPRKNDVVIRGISPFAKGLDVKRPVHTSAPVAITGSADVRAVGRPGAPPAKD